MVLASKHTRRRQQRFFHDWIRKYVKLPDLFRGVSVICQNYETMSFTYVLLLYSYVIIHLLNLNMTHFTIGVIHTRTGSRINLNSWTPSPLCNTKKVQMDKTDLAWSELQAGKGQGSSFYLLHKLFASIVILWNGTNNFLRGLNESASRTSRMTQWSLSHALLDSQWLQNSGKPLTDLTAS
jgi:hypothetical protein